MNKFSSSGIGHFQVTNSSYKPPFSPSPQLVAKQNSSNVRQLSGALHQEQEGKEIEETQEKFYEFDLHLNNQDQDNQYEVEDAIEENIEIDLNGDKEQTFKQEVQHNLKLKL